MCERVLTVDELLNNKVGNSVLLLNIVLDTNYLYAMSAECTSAKTELMRRLLGDVTTDVFVNLLKS